MGLETIHTRTHTHTPYFATAITSYTGLSTLLPAHLKPLAIDFTENATLTLVIFILWAVLQLEQKKNQAQ